MHFTPSKVIKMMEEILIIRGSGMSVSVQKLSKQIGIKEEELVTAGVRAYIKSELGKIEAQLHTLYHKYGIKSIKDLE
jgi:hypothetical protein